MSDQSHAIRARNELNAQIFNNGLTAWREWLADLQERLCRDLVAIALANRNSLGRDPLDWVNECIDNYWKTHRPGFKNWVILACDWADPQVGLLQVGYCPKFSTRL